MKRSLVSTLVLLAACAGATAADYLPLPGGQLRSVLPADGKTGPATVSPFLMRATLVSNAQYRDFVARHPAWQRGAVPAVLASPTYLAKWKGPLDHGALDANAPVTQVSWHAASAFCASEGGRLPRWYEWEYAAAADPTRPDARDDPAWLATILNWYSRPATSPPARIGLAGANLFGMQDMHGLVWEWVEDYSGMFVNADSRANDPDKQLDFCGGAAVSLGDRRNYAVLMRIALLAAMDGAQDGPYLGFRCVRDVPTTP